MSGVQFLGLDAAFTEDGLVLTEAPPVEGPGAPLGGLLDPLVGPLRDALAPVQDALADVLAQAVPQVDDLLAQAGITMRVVEPEDVDVESGAVPRVSSGLAIEFTYKGREQQQLADLINSVPDELKPIVGPDPVPARVLRGEPHHRLQPGPGQRSARWPPRRSTWASCRPLPTTPVGSRRGRPRHRASPLPGSARPLPDIPAAGTCSRPRSRPARGARLHRLDGAIPALLVLGALLLSPLFGMGSTKLADNVLAPVSTSCPTGQDEAAPPARLM